MIVGKSISRPRRKPRKPIGQSYRIRVSPFPLDLAGRHALGALALGRFAVWDFSCVVKRVKNRQA